MGSRVRHLKIKKVEDLQTPAVRALLKEARANALKRVKPEAIGHEGIRTVIKNPKAKKKP